VAICLQKLKKLKRAWKTCLTNKTAQGSVKTLGVFISTTMKLLLTADWHIRIGQKNVPKDWQTARFRGMFSELINVYNKHNCTRLVIAGDVFDKLPNMEELELYFEFLEMISNSEVQTYIISGNHEAVKKNTTFLSNLSRATMAASGGWASVVDVPVSIDGVDYLPYNCLKDFAEHPQKYFPEPSQILVTHVRGEIPPHVKPEVPLELFDKWKLVLAGDLHSHTNSQRNIVYPGSPLTTSFHRQETATGVVIVDTELGGYNFVEWDMPQLIRKTVQSKDEMVKTEYHHTIYELEGDAIDMSKGIDSELLDKKLVRKESKASLALTNDMSIRQSLVVYLQEVMKLDSAKLAQVLNVYDAYIKET
jgi:DNA repair exonuclease SbcCD nuclease subunit